MSQNSSSVPAADDDGAATGRDRSQTTPARLVLLVAAVALAIIGLLSLGAVLVSAWAGADPWPGFVTAAYFCLPLGFLLMLVTVVVNIVSRGRN
ncbi:hypothetical protein SAMN04488693_105200 [Arthrobacter subterraneus]|uniref:Multidrug ABC transporter ATPase n=1 Tax=Arthrobacter subterraneus TaxID=335973 RepID=A0A1G8HGU7_9MICC|nr:hypothetical protein [Arthrobacter subterraneus]SDI05873.1 hypothetical protein SAMN04488693_105200 [Arthrobacter subterraneus]